MLISFPFFLIFLSNLVSPVAMHKFVTSAGGERIFRAWSLPYHSSEDDLEGKHRAVKMLFLQSWMINDDDVPTCSAERFG